MSKRNPDTITSPPQLRLAQDLAKIIGDKNVSVEHLLEGSKKRSVDITLRIYNENDEEKWIFIEVEGKTHYEGGYGLTKTAKTLQRNRDIEEFRRQQAEMGSILDLVEVPTLVIPPYGQTNLEYEQLVNNLARGEIQAAKAIVKRISEERIKQIEERKKRIEERNKKWQPSSKQESKEEQSKKDETLKPIKIQQKILPEEKKKEESKKAEIDKKTEEVNLTKVIERIKKLRNQITIFLDKIERLGGLEAQEREVGTRNKPLVFDRKKKLGQRVSDVYSDNKEIKSINRELNELLKCNPEQYWEILQEDLSDIYNSLGRMVEFGENNAALEVRKEVGFLRRNMELLIPGINKTSTIDKEEKDKNWLIEDLNKGEIERTISPEVNGSFKSKMRRFEKEWIKMKDKTSNFLLNKGWIEFEANILRFINLTSLESLSKDKLISNEELLSLMEYFNQIHAKLSDLLSDQRMKVEVNKLNDNLIRKALPSINTRFLNAEFNRSEITDKNQETVKNFLKIKEDNRIIDPIPPRAMLLQIDRLGNQLQEFNLTLPQKDIDFKQRLEILQEAVKEKKAWEEENKNESNDRLNRTVINRFSEIENIIAGQQIIDAFNKRIQNLIELVKEASKEDKEEYQKELRSLKSQAKNSSIEIDISLLSSLEESLKKDLEEEKFEEYKKLPEKEDKQKEDKQKTAFVKSGKKVFGKKSVKLNIDAKSIVDSLEEDKKNKQKKQQEEREKLKRKKEEENKKNKDKNKNTVLNRLSSIFEVSYYRAIEEEFCGGFIRVPELLIVILKQTTIPGKLYLIIEKAIQNFNNNSHKFSHEELNEANQKAFNHGLDKVLSSKVDSLYRSQIKIIFLIFLIRNYIQTQNTFTDPAIKFLRFLCKETNNAFEEYKKMEEFTNRFAFTKEIESRVKEFEYIKKGLENELAENFKDKKEIEKRNPSPGQNKELNEITEKIRNIEERKKHICEELHSINETEKQAAKIESHIAACKVRIESLRNLTNTKLKKLEQLIGKQEIIKSQIEKKISESKNYIFEIQTLTIQETENDKRLKELNEIHGKLLEELQESKDKKNELVKKIEEEKKSITKIQLEGHELRKQINSERDELSRLIKNSPYNQSADSEDIRVHVEKVTELVNGLLANQEKKAEQEKIENTDENQPSQLINITEAQKLEATEEKLEHEI